MKKYAFLVLISIATLASCNIDSDPLNNFTLEVLPVEDVEIPEYFVHGETYEVFVTYTKPNSCYYFYDFTYDIQGYERVITVVNTVYANNDTGCVGEPEQVTVSFEFPVTGTSTYVFKFYQGEGDNGEDQYHLVEVPVMEGRATIEDTVKN